MSILKAIFIIAIYVALAYVAIVILKAVLVIAWSLLQTIGYWLLYFIDLPFYFLNSLQRWLSKPWRIFLKNNHGSEVAQWRWRHVLNWLKVPLYIVLTPLRLVNACYYNLVLHSLFETFNYSMEVICPSAEVEGNGSWWRWPLLLPWRIIKYLVWHELLMLTESVIWTVIDTFVPALTLFHGTSEDASQSITQSRGRVGNHSRLTEVWNVGGGNYAGNGIYFAPARSTAVHYAQGALIVCRVNLGNVLDLGLAPYKVYRQCGHPNATIATQWGLEHGFTTGEWWRKDAGWWEYCMYDWQNRYNESFRIRPLYVLDLDRHFLLRTPGGMHHWLFRRLVWDDIVHYFKH